MAVQRGWFDQLYVEIEHEHVVFADHYCHVYQTIHQYSKGGQ